MDDVKKVLRYISLYGFSRTAIKVAGRVRNSRLSICFPEKKAERNVSLIGCGQFGFSTISYFLYKNIGSCFLQCYDVDKKNSLSTAGFWGYVPAADWRGLIENPECKYVYIASDHYSHAEYAIEAVKAGKAVYCEKPVSVTREQLEDLIKAIKQYRAEAYFGYNRPFSKAINDLMPYIGKCREPVTLNCFISGHKLPADHWYNRPEEGTRICGNLGHWIDLSMFLFEQRGAIPETYDINITYSDKDEADDNIAVSYKTEYGDLVSLVLTSRTEPFEGINETINLQCGDVISKIDDFQRQTLWFKEKRHFYKYRPKDVGHAKAVIQPFIMKKRKMETVMMSTLLMLEIKDMVIAGKENEKYNMKKDVIFKHLAVENNEHISTRGGGN